MSNPKTMDPSQQKPAAEMTGDESQLAPRRFRFDVEPKTKRFTYTPTTDWGYETGQRVRFESPSGPFTITLERIDVSSSVSLQSSPLGTVLNGKQIDANLWATDEIIAGDGGLTKAQRDAAFLANIPPGGGRQDGFVARYKYHIKVTNVVPPFENTNDPKNGSFIC